MGNIALVGCSGRLCTDTMSEHAMQTSGKFATSRTFRAGAGFFTAMLFLAGSWQATGAFYAPVSNGYQVIPPPIGATVTSLPNGAVAENVRGTVYFQFGGAYYRPFYSGSSVIYEVVAKPG
jgi:hypothetical protein